VTTDILTLLTFCFGLPLFFETTGKCDIGFSTFLFMLSWYCLFAVFRLGVILGHFIYGRRFWNWVKRRACCKILSACEYEQRASFDIYNAKEYVSKVNKTIDLNSSTDSPQLSLSRQSSLKVKLQFPDLTCAICLEGFKENIALLDNDQT
jgi:hypothetical protein